MKVWGPELHVGDRRVGGHRGADSFFIGGAYEMMPLKTWTRVCVKMDLDLDLDLGALGVRFVASVPGLSR